MFKIRVSSRHDLRHQREPPCLNMVAAFEACWHALLSRSQVSLEAADGHTALQDLHVRFRGPKGELPKGVDGSYGTSLPLWKCTWDGSDVIIAWKQNGRILDPDHGYPVSFCIARS